MDEEKDSSNDGLKFNKNRKEEQEKRNAKMASNDERNEKLASKDEKKESNDGFEYNKKSKEEQKERKETGSYPQKIKPTRTTKYLYAQ